ncbi:MAG TPA: BTAD domain-containing putative transcriptional regulator [Acidimicrobiia bacterium]
MSIGSVEAAAPPLLARPRLEELSGRALKSRLTVLAAGAGFGKSTLLARWIETARAAHLTLTSADRSLPALSKRLADALRLRVPAIGADLNVEPATGPGAGVAIDRAAGHASFLASSLNRHLTKTVLLVLDDIDEVRGSESAALIDALVRQAPERLPIVLAGRADPDIRLARLRANGAVFDLGPRELSFSEEESAALARRVLGESEGAEVARSIHQATSGWPAATRLALEALRERRGRQASEFLKEAPSPGSLLFDYLAEEVIGAAPPEDRVLFAQLNTLGIFSSAMCEALGLASARRLEELARQGVFLEERGTDLAVRSLIGEFLDSQAILEAGSKGDLHRRASRWHSGRHEAIPAVHHAIAAGDHDLVVDVLTSFGERALTTGGALTVLEACRALDANRRTPVIDRLLGEAQLAVGDWEGAKATLSRAAGEAASIDPGLAWRMGLALHLRGELQEAIATYQRGDLSTGSLEDQALLLGWWAGAVWLTGDIEESRRLADEAWLRASAAESDRAMATALTAAAMLAAVAGDRRQNELLYLRALEHAERAGDVLQLIRIHVNRGSRHLEEGSYEEAIAETELALPLADLAGYTALRALGVNNRGQARLQLGRFEEAAADFRESHQLWQRLSARQVAYALSATGDIHRIRGDLNLARFSYEEACRVAEPVTDAQALVPALAGLARVIAAEDPAEADSLLKQAGGSGQMLGQAQVLLATAEVRLAQGDHLLAADAAVAALDFAMTRRDRASAAEALELLAAAGVNPVTHLGEAISIWRDLSNPLGQARAELRLSALLGAKEETALELRGRLRRLGARRLAEEADRLVDDLRQRSRPAVSIGALGGFRVNVDGIPVPATAWQSKKARDIVKVLIARRGKPLHREALVEMLWPEEDPRKTSNRLSVALSIVRAIFDPSRQHPADHYISADRDSVGLHADRLEIDLEAFHYAAATGLAAVREVEIDRARALLETAEAAYLGDLLEEEPYEDWASDAREDARATYIRVARWLADDAIDRGDLDGSIRYLLRILQRDPYDEAAHLKLIKSMIDARRHGEARRLYRQYGSRMEELSVEAAPYPG